jgi:hypothetical protein
MRPPPATSIDSIDGVCGLNITSLPINIRLFEALDRKRTHPYSAWEPYPHDRVADRDICGKRSAISHQPSGGRRRAWNLPEPLGDQRHLGPPPDR